MDFIKKFIEANRQTGTTTALIRAVRETRGYLIVSTMDIKARHMRNHPDIKERIFTLNELKDGGWRGKSEGCVFFDTDALWAMASKPDGYAPIKVVTASGEVRETINLLDGYQGKVEEQLNIKLTKEDMEEIKHINKDFFEGEASNSMLGRILVRKGIYFYKKLKNSLDLHSL